MQKVIQEYQRLWSEQQKAQVPGYCIAVCFKSSSVCDKDDEKEQKGGKGGKGGAMAERGQRRHVRTKSSNRREKNRKAQKVELELGKQILLKVTSYLISI